MARNLGVSADNDFALLAALGGDTAGAVSLLAPGERPAPVGRDVQWLGESELATLIDELPSRPLHADADGEYPPLAGRRTGQAARGPRRRRADRPHEGSHPVHSHTQDPDRWPRWDDRQRGAMPCDRQDPRDRRRCAPHHDGSPSREFLLVERYDREHAEDAVRRLHQEDFCQALGIPARRKYQNEGGPGLEDCFSLLREVVAVPAREALKLLDAVVLSFLIGNNDAHGKNYSLLYLPDSPKAALAPTYDLLSTAVYPGLSRKMAMSIGGEYRPDYVQPRHLNQFLEQAGLGPAAARRRIRVLADAAPSAAHQASASLAEEGWSAPVLARIVETRRETRLADPGDRRARTGPRPCRLRRALEHAPPRRSVLAPAWRRPCSPHRGPTEMHRGRPPRECRCKRIATAEHAKRREPRRKPARAKPSVFAAFRLCTLDFANLRFSGRAGTRTPDPLGVNEVL